MFIHELKTEFHVGTILLQCPESYYHIMTSKSVKHELEMNFLTCNKYITLYNKRALTNIWP